MGPAAAMAHVLVMPLSTMGHINPMLRFAIRLARKGVGITFVSSVEAIAGLAGAAGEGPSSELHGLDFRLVGLDMPPDLISGSHAVSERFREAFQPMMQKYILDKSAGIAVPTSIVSDMFLPWTQDAAERLQIPMYVFVPSGVVFARLMQGCLPYFEAGKLQISEADGKLVAFDWAIDIPGLSPLHYHELPQSIRQQPAEFWKRGQTLGKSAGIVANSFLELEQKVIDTWRRVGYPGFEHIKVPKVFPVGPLFSSSASIAPRGSEDSANKCLHWLDSQPSSSVLYAAFGSQFRLSPQNIHAVALGLEASKHRFLWVIPLWKPTTGVESPSSVTEVLPPDFQARVGDRGCIVTGWAPQLQILAHSATGGFFTHCGWNSSLESTVLGVPMISSPQGAEQFVNCRYLVDDLKIAQQVRTGPGNSLNASEVERLVRLLMEESEGQAMKSRVEELKRKAAAAVADGGSQSRVFQEFFDDLHKHEPALMSGK